MPNHNQELRNKTILITGSTGLIGSAVVRKLASLCTKTHVALRSETKSERFETVGDSVKRHFVDLENYSQLTKVFDEIQPEIVFNFAETAPFESNELQELVYKSHQGMKMLANLLDLCKTYNVKKVLHACSSTIYEGGGTETYLEDSPKNPNSFRGLVKSQERDLCRFFANKHKLPVALGRIFRAYGPWDSDKKLIVSSLQKRNLRMPIALVSDEIKRDYIHVDDIASLFIRLAESDFPPGYEVNVGSGIERSAREIINALNNVLSEPKIEVDETKQYELSQMDKKYWRADVSRAKADLGWEPKISLEDGLKGVVRWFDSLGDHDY